MERYSRRRRRKGTGARMETVDEAVMRWRVSFLGHDHKMPAETPRQQAMEPSRRQSEQHPVAFAKKMFDLRLHAGKIGEHFPDLSHGKTPDHRTELVLVLERHLQEAVHQLVERAPVIKHDARLTALPEHAEGLLDRALGVGRMVQDSEGIHVIEGFVREGQMTG